MVARDDRPSAPLGEPWLKLLSIAGWLLIAAFAALVAADVVAEDEMTDAEWRADFISFWTAEGYERDVAECAATEFDKGAYESEEAGRELTRALEFCEGRFGDAGWKRTFIATWTERGVDRKLAECAADEVLENREKLGEAAATNLGFADCTVRLGGNIGPDTPRVSVP